MTAARVMTVGKAIQAHTDVMIETSFEAVASRSQRTPTDLQRFAKFIGPDILKRDGSWIVGGTVRRALEAVESHADIDIYSATPEARDETRNRLKWTRFEFQREQNQCEVWRRENWRVDLSGRIFCEAPEKWIADYTICQFVVFYDGDDLRLMYGEHSMHDLMHRLLMPQEAGVYSLDKLTMRARKYHHQGFVITPQSMAEMARIIRAKPHLLQEL